MARRGWRFLGWMMIVLGCGTARPVRAADLLPQAGAWDIGLRSGYSLGLGKHVEMVPVNLHLGYTVFKGKKWIIPAGSFELAIEPFGSAITAARNNSNTAHGSMELGLGLPILTYYFNLGNHLTPYIEG